TARSRPCSAAPSCGSCTPGRSRPFATACVLIPISFVDDKSAIHLKTEATSSSVREKPFTDLAATSPTRYGAPDTVCPAEALDLYGSARGAGCEARCDRVAHGCARRLQRWDGRPACLDQRRVNDRFDQLRGVVAEPGCCGGPH